MRLFDCCIRKPKEEQKPIIKVTQQPFVPDAVKVILQPLWQHGAYHNTWGRQ
jgi:hypothetical protein